jgi:hypothetical protein
LISLPLSITFYAVSLACYLISVPVLSYNLNLASSLKSLALSIAYEPFSIALFFKSCPLSLTCSIIPYPLSRPKSLSLPLNSSPLRWNYSDRFLESLV